MTDHRDCTLEDGEPEADRTLAERVAELADRINDGKAASPVAEDERDPGRGEALLQMLPAMEMLSRLRGVAHAGLANPTAEAGRIIGDFRLIRVIGRGGMGVVYEAEQVSLDRRVALKTIPALSADDSRLLKRFHSEVLAAACLQHPHIIPVFTVGQEDGVPYYAMQLIVGCTVADLIAGCSRSEKPGARSDSPPRVECVPPRVVAELGRQAAEALHHAHEQGVVHRDIKPGNLLVEDSGWLWVADFGLASVQNAVQSSACDAVRGTLQYLSPEQALGRSTAVDHRTDVYSLGATLYEMLALRPVHEGDDRVETLRKISGEEPSPLGRVAPATPAELATVVMKAIAKDRADRYATAGEMADDLCRFLEHRPIRARPPGVFERAARWGRRHRSVVRAAVALAVFVTTGIAAVAVWRDATLRHHNLALTSALALAEQRELTNRRLWNGSQVRLAQQELESGQVDFAQETLERLRPRPGEPDLRGFEWHFLRQLAHRDVSLLFGHEAPVYALAVSPDGQTLVSGDERGMVVFWDLVAWRERGRVRGHSAGVATLAFAPDGLTVSSSSGGPEPNEVKLWDPATARVLASIPGISGSVLGVAFSHDGRSMAVCDRKIGVGGGDGRVTLWSLSPGPNFALTGLMTIDSEFLAVSPDRRFLATAIGSGQVTLRDPSTGRATRALPGPFSAVRGVGFTPDGRSVLVEDDGGLSSFDLVTGGRAGRIASTPGVPVSMTLHANYFYGLPLRRGMDFCLTDAWFGLLPTFLQGVPTKNPRFLFSPDGRLLAGVGHLPSATLWDASSGKKLAEYPLAARNVRSLTFSDRGKSLIFGSEDARIRTWHIEKHPGSPDSLPGHDREVWALAYTPDGNTLISASDDHTIKLWDPAGGSLRGRLTGHLALVSSLAVSPDGTTLASGGFDKTVRLWDLRSGRAGVVLAGHTDRVRGVAFSPDGRLLASCSSDASIRLWDVSKGREVATLKGHTDGLHDLAFDPCGTRLASAGNDRTIRIWEPGGRGPLAFATPGSNTALAFSPDGALLASGDDLGNVVVWDSRTLARCATIKGSDAPVWGLAFSPDGRSLACACGDAKVRLWDPTTWQLTLVLGGHARRVNAVAFSPDGRALASASHDGAIKLWHADRP